MKRMIVAATKSDVHIDLSEMNYSNFQNPDHAQKVVKMMIDEIIKSLGDVDGLDLTLRVVISDETYWLHDKEGYILFELRDSYISDSPFFVHPTSKHYADTPQLSKSINLEIDENGQFCDIPWPNSRFNHYVAGLPSIVKKLKKLKLDTNNLQSTTLSGLDYQTIAALSLYASWFSRHQYEASDSLDLIQYKRDALATEERKNPEYYKNCMEKLDVIEEVVRDKQLLGLSDLIKICKDAKKYIDTRRNQQRFNGGTHEYNIAKEILMHCSEK